MIYYSKYSQFSVAKVRCIFNGEQKIQTPLSSNEGRAATWRIESHSDSYQEIPHLNFHFPFGPIPWYMTVARPESCPWLAAFAEGRKGPRCEMAPGSLPAWCWHTSCSALIKWSRQVKNRQTPQLQPVITQPAGPCSLASQLLEPPLGLPPAWPFIHSHFPKAAIFTES